MATIDIGLEFTRYPVGRFERDGEHTGEGFRNHFLIPALNKLTPNEVLVVIFDGTMGVASAFLEEAFGGLIRNSSYTAADLKEKLEIVSNEDPTLIDETWEYIGTAKKR